MAIFLPFITHRAASQSAVSTAVGRGGTGLNVGWSVSAGSVGRSLGR